jgi:membrane-associated phospholipid phosphatase
VSAPSFHAAAGVLLLIFAARQPAIRMPLVAANVAMLLSTPVEGTHYLTDVVLGAVVACMSLGLVALALPKLGRKPVPA